MWPLPLCGGLLVKQRPDDAQKSEAAEKEADQWLCESQHWLDELAKKRRALSRPAPVPPARVSRSEFLQAYKTALARRLSVFAKRDNVASARLALRNVLVD